MLARAQTGKRLANVRCGAAAFKTYRQLAPHLLRDGVLVLPRPPTCLRCGADCGFVKDGHYFRDFIFVGTVLTDVGVQRYLCKRNPDATFSALAAFQESRAHYTVHVRGTVLEHMFLKGRSVRSAWRALRSTRGGASLARSTVSDWCRRFQTVVPKHAAALHAHLAQHLPRLDSETPADAGLFLRAARAAFRLYLRASRGSFWEWLNDLLARAAGRTLLAA